MMNHKWRLYPEMHNFATTAVVTLAILGSIWIRITIGLKEPLGYLVPHDICPFNVPECLHFHA